MSKGEWYRRKTNTRGEPLSKTFLFSRAESEKTTVTIEGKERRARSNKMVKNASSGHFASPQSNGICDRGMFNESRNIKVNVRYTYHKVGDLTASQKIV